MKPTSYTAKLLRALLLPVMVVVAFQVYQIAQAPPADRRNKIFALVVTVATIAVIAVLTGRQEKLSPDNPRLSPFILVGITLVLIIMAVLFRRL